MNGLRKWAVVVAVPALSTALALLSVGCHQDASEIERHDLFAEVAFARASEAVELSRSKESGELLVLPAGAKLDFSVWIEPQSRLVLVGDGELEAVEVEVETDTRPTEQLVAAHRRHELDFDLGAVAAEAMRIGIRAGQQPVTLSSARIERPKGLPNGIEVSSGPGSGPFRDLQRPAGRRPNIVVYLIDTLRPDHLGCYGYERPTSPEIDAFAGSAFRFDDALAQSSWTKSAVASIFTGLWPKSHGANDYESRLAEDHQTLAEQLRAVGYDTAAFVTNPNITVEFGFDQGFDEFVDLRHTGARSPRVQEAFELWLEQRATDEPFFAYLHTVDPHLPYAPPAPFLERFASEVVDPATTGSRERMNQLQSKQLEATPERVAALIDLYDGEVAANDVSFGRMLRALEAAGAREQTVVVLVSDHGEEFFEHGNFTHGKQLFEESVRVPLLISVPDDILPTDSTAAAEDIGDTGAREPAAVIADRVEQIDLFTTVLELAGTTPSSPVEGRSLVPLMAGKKLPPRSTYAHIQLVGPLRLAIWEGGYKRVETRRRGKAVASYLFDLSNDSEEQNDLTDRYPIRATYLAVQLEKKWSQEAPASTETVEIDPQTRDQLEALGYLQ